MKTKLENFNFFSLSIIIQICIVLQGCWHGVCVRGCVFEQVCIYVCVDSLQ